MQVLYYVDLNLLTGYLSLKKKKEEDKSFFDNNFADSGRKKINDNQLKIITKTLNIQQWFHDVCMKGQFDRRLKIIKVENAFRKLEEIS